MQEEEQTLQQQIIHAIKDPLCNASQIIQGKWIETNKTYNGFGCII